MATLQHIEAYNAQMKGDIAVTRRATYKAEADVQRAEAAKIDQDHLIDRMQEQLQGLQQNTALLVGQVLLARSARSWRACGGASAGSCGRPYLPAGE